jgi:hypothetical protein
MPKRSAPAIVDTSHLTDADWSEINKLQRAYKKGGTKAFSKALDELGDKDPIKYLAVASAYFPREVREAVKDNIAAVGLTVEEFDELIEGLEDFSGTKH